MILRILICSLFALSAANALAGNMYLHKDNSGQVLITNVNPSGNLDGFTKKVKVTYYRDSNVYDADKPSQKQVNSKEQNVSHGSSSNSNSASYADLAYIGLR